MSTSLKISACTIICALCFPTVTLAQSNDTYERLINRVLKDTIDNNFNNEGKSQGITGVIGGMLTHDNYTHTAGAGYREMYKDGTANLATALKGDEMMRVGSQTKTYIGTLVLQLVDKGKLKTTDTLGELNQRLGLGIDLSIAPGAEKTTVQQLLTMSSGIKDYLHVPYTDKNGKTWSSFSAFWESEDRKTDITPQELINLGLTGYFDTPAEGFDGTYSNTNTAILGLVAEKITGKPLHELVNNMLKEIGLNTDNIFFPEGDDETLEKIKDKIVHGYINSENGGLKDTTVCDPDVPWAAGAIVADAKSQLLWLSTLVHNTGGLLDDETFQERLEGAQWTDGDGKNLVDVSTFVTQYGQFLYTMTSPVTGQDLIGHAGSITGYVSMLGWFPHLDMGLVANTAGGNFNSSGILTTVAAPFFSMELALTRAKYQSGSINTIDGITTLSGGEAQFYEGKPDLEVGTRGIVRLDPIKTGEGNFGSTIVIESTERDITYVEPETIPYMNQKVTHVDPTLTFYKDLPTTDTSDDKSSAEEDTTYVAALEASKDGQIVVNDNARVEARSAYTIAVDVSSNSASALIYGQVAAYGKNSYALQVSEGEALIGKQGLAWAQGLGAAGLYVENGTVDLQGTAQGSWGANGLRMEGGSVNVAEGGAILASTLFIPDVNGNFVTAPVSVHMTGGELNVSGSILSQYAKGLAGLSLSAEGYSKVAIKEGGLISGRIELGDSSQLTFESQSTFAINLNQFNEGDFAISYKEPSSEEVPIPTLQGGSKPLITVEEGAQLSIDGARLNQSIAFIDEKITQIDLSNWNIDLGTYLLKADLNKDGTLVTSEGVSVSDIPYISQEQAQIVRNLLESGLNRSDSLAGIAFLSQLFDDRVVERSKAIAQWQSLADMPGVLNVANTTLGISTQLTNVWRDRLSQMNSLEEEAASRHFWATPWYGHNRIDGLKTGSYQQNAKTNSYGLAIGLEANNQNFMVGLSLQAGHSQTEGRNLWNSLQTEGNFFGLGAYAGFNVGSITFLSDFGITELDSDLSNGSIASKVDGLSSSVFTAGVQLQTQLPLSPSLSLTPFVGARFNHYRQQGYRVTGNNGDFFEAGKTHANQFSFPIGAGLNWDMAQTQSGWQIRSQVQMAYIYTTGDLDLRTPIGVSGRKDLGVAHFTSEITDRHRYQTHVTLETQKDDFTLGLSLGGDLSSNQQDLKATANVLWRF